VERGDPDESPVGGISDLQLSVRLERNYQVEVLNASVGTYRDSSRGGDSNRGDRDNRGGRGGRNGRDCRDDRSSQSSSRRSNSTRATSSYSKSRRSQSSTTNNRNDGSSRGESNRGGQRERQKRQEPTGSRSDRTKISNRTTRNGSSRGRRRKRQEQQKLGGGGGNRSSSRDDRTSKRDDRRSESSGSSRNRGGGRQRRRNSGRTQESDRTGTGVSISISTGISIGIGIGISRDGGKSRDSNRRNRSHILPHVLQREDSIDPGFLWCGDGGVAVLHLCCCCAWLLVSCEQRDRLYRGPTYKEWLVVGTEKKTGTKAQKCPFFVVVDGRKGTHSAIFLKAAEVGTIKARNHGRITRGVNILEPQKANSCWPPLWCSWLEKRNMS
jgi:hypothetical protein